MEGIAVNNEVTLGTLVPKRELKAGEYIEKVGRRKTATARVRLTKAGKTTYTVNGNPLADYFKTDILQAVSKAALVESELEQKYTVSVHVKGGGTQAQAESMRHGMARALVELEPELRKDLKKKGYLKRDPRMKERKKFGLKGARRAAQWSKR